MTHVIEILAAGVLATQGGQDISSYDIDLVKPRPTPPQTHTDG